MVRIAFIMEYLDIMKMICRDWPAAKLLIKEIIILKNMLSCLLPDTELVYLCSIWIIYI